MTQNYILNAEKSAETVSLFTSIGTSVQLLLHAIILSDSHVAEMIVT